MPQVCMPKEPYKRALSNAKETYYALTHTPQDKVNNVPSPLPRTYLQIQHARRSPIQPTTGTRAAGKETCLAFEQKKDSRDDLDASVGAPDLAIIYECEKCGQPFDDFSSARMYSSMPASVHCGTCVCTAHCVASMYAYTHACTHAGKQARIYTHAHFDTHSYTHVHTHALTRAHTHARTHAHAHTHTHTHMHAAALRSNLTFF